MFTTIPAVPDPRDMSADDAIRDRIERMREASSTLRWHQGMRRRWRECRLEAQAWTAADAATLAGFPPVGLPVVRTVFLDPGQVCADGDPGLAGVAAAVRAMSTASRWLPDLGGTQQRGVGVPMAKATRTIALPPLRQVLARVHSSLGEVPGLTRRSTLGRPDSSDSAGRISDLARLVDGFSGTDAVVTIAIVHAEIDRGLMAGGSTIVAEAIARTLLVSWGCDPSGAAVPSHPRVADADARRALLAAYHRGDATAQRAWVAAYIDDVVAGCEWGCRLAESVVAGVALS